MYLHYRFTQISAVTQIESIVFPYVVVNCLIDFRIFRNIVL